MEGERCASAVTCRFCLARMKDAIVAEDYALMRRLKELAKHTLHLAPGEALQEARMRWMRDSGGLAVMFICGGTERPSPPS